MLNVVSILTKPIRVDLEQGSVDYGELASSYFCK